MLRRLFWIVTPLFAIACRGEAPQRSPEPSNVLIPSLPDSNRLTTPTVSADTGSRPTATSDSSPRTWPPVLVVAVPRIDSGATTAVELNLTSVAASLDSLRSILRPDSGTARADSMYLRFREGFERSVRAITRPFDGPGFQRIMYARIAELEHGVRSPLPASFAATADSVIDFFRDHAIRSYQAEGLAYFTPDDAVIVERVGSLLTEPMREHLRLEILEQTHPLGGDGAIAVSWDELSSRLAATDRLLTHHPGFAARVSRTDRFRSYLGLYLAGGPNTPTFDHRSKVLLPEVRQSYERYTQRHGTLRSALLVRDYMALLATTGYRPLPSVVAFIEENSGFVVRPAR